MKSVTPTFQQALRMRRHKQAQQIIARFRKHLERGRVLDYGCGQGAFVQELLEAGFSDASGADISLLGCESQLPEGHFVALAAPWDLPTEWNLLTAKPNRTVCLLDVLEHNERPDLFVARLHACGFESLLIKVPMLNGPIGRAAQLAVRLGKNQLMRRLLLTGETSPHYTFFSSRGLCTLVSKQGFELCDSMRIADVGAELPERLRSDSGEVSFGSLHPLLCAVGSGLELLASFWSDTQIFLFRRRV